MGDASTLKCPFCGDDVTPSYRDRDGTTPTGHWYCITAASCSAVA